MVSNAIKTHKSVDKVIRYPKNVGIPVASPCTKLLNNSKRHFKIASFEGKFNSYTPVSWNLKFNCPVASPLSCNVHQIKFSETWLSPKHDNVIIQNCTLKLRHLKGHLMLTLLFCETGNSIVLLPVQYSEICIKSNFRKLDYRKNMI